MLDRVGSTVRARESEKQALEQALDAARTPTHFEGGRWAVLISLIALMLSVFSLYETILKQARPAVYVGGVMHYARDPVGGVEVFAIPLTITNHGARDAIIISLDLGVAPLKSGRPASLTFASAYVGSNPAREKQPFTPLSIPGRGSFTGIVLFYPNDLKDGAANAVVIGKETYRFCVTVRTEKSQDYRLLDTVLGTPLTALSLEAALLWFSTPELVAGKTIPMQIKNARRHDLRRHAQPTNLACD